MKEIVVTLLIALALVILVVFLFLQSWRATLIPLLAVPVSLVGTFVLFPLFGFSINTLSLFGLVLAIGLVVDDAIVVVEGVERHIEEGMTPKDAALKAMEELSGPVVGIALVLSAVFVPTAFIPGITGKLYQQFAVTIAISVLLSAFNALTLSPALAALLLKPRTPSRGLLRRFFDWFNRVFERATEGYVRWSAVLVQKTVVVVVLLVVFCGAGFFFANRIPSSFLPDEDQGYAYVNVQLPNGASLERTTAVTADVEKILMNTPGVEHVTSFVGFSLLSFVRTSYNSTFFVTLKPWGERKTRDEQFQTFKAHLNQQLSKLPAAVAFGFSPPAIPGVGTAGGFTFILEDRSGGDIQFLAKNLSTFLDAARKRPEIASVSTTFLASVPQQFVDVNRDKVLKQGVALNDVYRTIQAFMGGYFINYFNRFGRQWQVYIEAESEDRAKAENVGQFYVRNNKGENVPLSTLTTIKAAPRPGIYFALQRISFGADQRERRARLQRGPGHGRPRRRFQTNHAPRDGFRLFGYFLSGTESARGCAAVGDLRTLAAIRLPDSGGALRKLVAALQRAAEHARRDLRSLWQSFGCAACCSAFSAALPGPDRNRCLLANRTGHAHRPGSEERDSDRRVRQGRIRERKASGGCRARRSQASPAANSDDVFRVHSRLRAAMDGERRRVGCPANHGHDRDRRDDGRQRDRNLLRAGDLLPGGEMVRRRQGAGRWPRCQERLRRRRETEMVHLPRWTRARQETCGRLS